MDISIWEKESFFAPCDVLIAGSGFTGLWSAYFLKKQQPDLRVTIIDKGIIPTGASTRNAGFACYGSATELLKDAELMGEDRMLSLVEMRYRGLRQIQQVFSREEIGYENHGGYELIDEKDIYGLNNRIAWLNKLLEPLFHTDNTFRFEDHRINEFGFAGVQHLLFTQPEGQLHSGKLCMLLLQKVQAMGVTVLPATAITGFEESEGKVTVFTDGHFSILSNRLIVCTNAFANKLLPDLDIVPARGQVLVTAPIPSLRFKGTFHYNEGFYYFRNLGNRLLLGGARNTAIHEETTVEMKVTENIQAHLERFIADRLLPGCSFEITDRWSGIMGLGGEKMPIIKQISPGVYCAVRMSGMGVALAPVAAEKIALMIAGK